MSINDVMDRATDRDATTNATMPPPSAVATQAVDPLDELKDLDLLLEDIEDKIAPLAL